MKLIDLEQLRKDLADTGYFTVGDVEVLERVLTQQKILATRETGRMLIELVREDDLEDAPLRMVGDDPHHDRMVLDDENRLRYYNMQTGESSPEDVMIVPGIIEQDGMETCVCEKCFVFRYEDLEK